MGNTGKTSRRGTSKAAASSPLDLGDVRLRVEMNFQRQLVIEAVSKSRPAKRSGGTPTMWKLSIGTLIDIAEASIIDHQSPREIRRDFSLGNAFPLRSLERWLATINSKYDSILSSKLDERIAGAELDGARGDLPTQNAIFHAAMLRRIMPCVAKLDWDAMSPQEQHVWLRLMEVTTSASEAQSKVHLNETRQAQLRRAIDTLNGDVRRGDITPEEALKQATTIVNTMVGVGVGNGSREEVAA